MQIQGNGMVVSKTTAEQILQIMLKHVKMDKKVIAAIIEDLHKVNGNKSFKDTIALLERLQHEDE